MLRRVLALAASLAMLLSLTACSGDSDELVVYSGRGQNLIGPLLEQFAEETDTPIAVRYGDSADLALLLGEEGAATDADVFLAQNPGSVAFVGAQDLLGELPQEVLDLVDERFRSDNDRWVGLSGRQRVLVYNQDLVAADELPSSVFDLTGDEYAGRVAVAPPNGSFQDFVSAMQLAEGEERTLAWLEGMVANDAPTYPNNNSIVDAVGRGEVEMGLVNHYYNLRFLAEDPDLPSRNHRFAGDDIGALLIPSSISILDGTDQPEAAQQLVEFMLSAEAQEFYRDQTFEYPLAAEVSPPEGVPSLAELGTPDVDLDDLGTELQSTVELIERSGLQN